MKTSTLIFAFILSITIYLSVERNVRGQEYSGNNPAYTIEQISKLLIETDERLKTIPEDVNEDSFNGRLISQLKKQKHNLEKLIALLRVERDQIPDFSNTTKELNARERELVEFSKENHTIVVANPTQNEFNQLTMEAIKHRKKIADLKEKIRNNNKVIKKAPEQKKRLDTQKTEAKNKTVSLVEERAAESDENEKALLDIRKTISETEEQICLALIRSFDNDINRLDQMLPLLNIELQIEEQRVKNISETMQTYSQTLKRELEEQQRQTEIVYARKEKQAEKAETPQEIFIAMWETKLAFAQKNISELKAYTITQQKLFNEIDHRLLTEKDKLQYFTNRLNQLGPSAIPANRIKRELQRVEKSKKILKNILPPNYEEIIDRYEIREFEIDDELQNFDELWIEDLLTATFELTQSEYNNFSEANSSLSTDYKKALKEEKGILVRFIDIDQKIVRHILERTEVLDEIERIVWSSRYWIQDGEPKNLNFLKKIVKEFMVIGYKIKKPVHTKTSKNAPQILNSIKTQLYGVLLFIGIPVLLFFLRKRLTKFASIYNRKTLEYGHRWQNKTASVLTGVASSLTLPIYFYLASKIISNAGLPENISKLSELVCFFAGVFLFLFFLNRAFFSKQGVAHVQFGLNIDSSRVIYLALQIIIIANITSRMFRDISETVFMISAIPDLVLLFELLTQGSVIWWALRKESPLIQNEILTKQTSFLARYWTLISYIIFSIIIVVWVLAITGYNYTASQFSRSLLRSIFTAFLLPPIYRLTIQFVENFGLKKLLKLPTTDTECTENDKKEEVSRITDQAKSVIRILFYIAAVLIIANLWGLDDRALKTFDEIGVYKVTNSLDENEIVSIGDLLRFALVILITTWVLRNLKGIAKYTVFLKLKVDEGIKYAILTITRYSIFFISALFALSTIHLDLGRLGWLVAAMGVGLGFGLQEIVSNFFSGIIILIERPIRVDDIVTIGTNIGTVTHINIRSTTIVNFDRQELIVPNRMIITQEVTNWTRGDNVIRLKIPIGVAYSTDIDKVSELLINIAKDYKQVLKDPAPSVFFVNHGDSSLDFELRVFLSTPEVKWEALDYINKQINRALSENGIEIPFPQRDIYLKKT